MQREVAASPDGAARVDERPRRICLLVLGMHRSGTSAVARVAGLLGADLPRTLIGPNAGNERGHWEPAPLVAQHDALLERLGSRWDDWRRLDVQSLSPAERAEVERALHAQIEEEYGGSPLFVLKDPRICRFAAFVVELLEAEGITARPVLVLRNPLAVAASLKARDGITAGFAALMWLRHMLDAEAATRHMPRAIVSYEDLLLDWGAAMHRVGVRTGLGWPCPIEVSGPHVETFLSRALQHHAPSARELAASGDVPDWVKGAYAALRALERDPDDEAVLGRLNGIRAEFDAAAPAFAAAIIPELEARESGAAELRRQLAMLQERVRAGETRTAELSKALSLREHASSELAAVRAQLGAVYVSRSWRVTAPLRFAVMKLRQVRHTAGQHILNASEKLARGLRLRTQALGSGPLARRLRPIPRNFPDTLPLRVFEPATSIAVVVHMFHSDLWPELSDAIRRIPSPFDLFVTLVAGHTDDLTDEVLARFPSAIVLSLPNHGRDIYPFIFINNTGVLGKYGLVCKVHSKKSSHRHDGDAWRRSMLTSLLGNAERIQAIIDRFATDPDLGIVAAAANLGTHENWSSNERLVCKLASRLHMKVRVEDIRFAAGSMFWISPRVLRTLQALELTEDDFEVELGQLDGTMAHAVERFIGIAAQHGGMVVLAADEIADPRLRAPAVPGSADLRLK